VMTHSGRFSISSPIRSTSLIQTMTHHALTQLTQSWPYCRWWRATWNHSCRRMHACLDIGLSLWGTWRFCIRIDSMHGKIVVVWTRWAWDGWIDGWCCIPWRRKSMLS
jgi:hypothetical protein